MFTLPIWVAVLYGVLMLLALFLVFLLSLIADKQRHQIKRLRYTILIMRKTTQP